MPSTFSSINEAQGAGVPQFQQTQPVVGVKGEGVMSAAALGASLFQQATQFGQQKAAAEGQTAVGSLQTKLVKIRQAGATDSSINVVAQQRLALTEFNAQNPSLAQDGMKAFKIATGTTPGGLSITEKAEIDLDNEAIKAGHGYHGADPVYQDKMTRHYVSLKQEDANRARRVAKMNEEVLAGTMHKSVLRDEIHAGARSMFSISADKTNDEMSDIEARYANGTLSLEEALMMTTLAANNVNREIASLGEFSTDPVINVYSQPTLDRIQLSVDILNSKFEGDAATAIMDRNKKVAKAKLLADPEILALSVATEVFPNVTGTDSKITGAVLRVLNEGMMTEDDMLPTKPQPVKFQGLDEGEKDVITKSLDTMFQGGLEGHIERTIAEASTTLTGIAEYVNRNGDLISKEDTNFYVNLLNIPGAFESLSPSQRSVVMQGMNTYVADVVDVAARESIVNAEIQVTDPRKFEGVNFLSANTREKKPASEVADLVVADGLIYWKLKPSHAGLPKAQSDIRKLNKDIADNITPAVTVNSKGLGVSFEDAAGVFFPIDGVGEVKEEAPVKDEAKTDVKATRKEAGVSRADLAKKAASVSPTSATFKSGASKGVPDLVNDKGTRTLRGTSAVAEVERIEGELTDVQKAVVVEEGYVNGYYEDDTGVKTGGVGQTGKFLGMTFKESFKAHEKIASRVIQDYDSLPTTVQASIMSATYRGDLKSSHQWVKLFNQGLYKEASEEFLDHDEYKRRLAKGGDGVTERLESISRVIGNFKG